MTTTKPLPSLEYLKECFELSSESPSGLVWKKRPRKHFNTQRGCSQTNARFAGKVAGHLWTSDNTGRQYYVVGISGVNYVVHRIIFSIFHKVSVSPLIEIDHRDTDSTNNTPTNLRLATHSQNQQNQKAFKTNKSGYKGVCWYPSNKSWCYAVQVNGVRFRGFAPTAESANELAIARRKTLHQQFARN